MTDKNPGTTTTTPEIEQWHCYDERLPKELPCEPPHISFMESVWERQLQAIGIAELDGNHYLAFGRRRLYAIRKGTEKKRQPHSGMIDVVIFPVKSMDEIHQLAVEENKHRSPNPISDVKAIRALLTTKSATYKSVAKALHMSEPQVKKIEAAWDGVPDWCVDAMLDGNMAMGTAKKVGKMKPDTQKKLRKQFKANENKLTLKDVSEVRAVVRTQAQAVALPTLKVKRSFFSREEIEHLAGLPENAIKLALKKLLEE